MRSVASQVGTDKDKRVSARHCVGCAKSVLKGQRQKGRRREGGVFTQLVLI